MFPQKRSAQHFRRILRLIGDDRGLDAPRPYILQKRRFAFKHFRAPVVPMHVQIAVIGIALVQPVPFIFGQRHRRKLAAAVPHE